MLIALRTSASLSLLIFALGILAAGCSHEAPSPAVSITGAMAPLAGVGSLLSVTASGPGNKDYTVAADAGTGVFRFCDLPAGTYTLKFATTAAPNFPNRVKVEVQQGATATPKSPLITHDGVGRGLMRWVADGQPHSVAGLVRVYDAGDNFNVLGQVGELDKGAAVYQLSLFVPKLVEAKELFVGAGTYMLGGKEFGSRASVAYYPTGQTMLKADYETSLVGAPTGTLRLTRYDAEQGLATGTFEFSGRQAGGHGDYTNLPAQTAITRGEVDITF